MFEGGVRSASFVYSSLIPEAQRGAVHHGLFHSVDWLPTLVGRLSRSHAQLAPAAAATTVAKHSVGVTQVGLAGGSTAKNLPLDGKDIWSSLLAGGRTSPHDELPINIAACGADFKGESIVDGPQVIV